MPSSSLRLPSEGGYVSDLSFSKSEQKLGCGAVGNRIFPTISRHAATCIAVSDVLRAVTTLINLEHRFDFELNYMYTEGCALYADTWTDNFTLLDSEFSQTEKGGDATNISVSTAFNPSTNARPDPIDLILSSADTIFFYVHSTHILAGSLNAFNMLLSPSSGTSTSHSSHGQYQIVHVPEVASVLNVVLHALYGLPVASFAPTFDDLITAVEAMPKYGLDVMQYAAPGTELAELLLAFAPLHPLDVYALASTHKLTDLAERASPHLLSLQLTKITDEMAERTGAVPLKKLFFLHLGRVDALKRLLYTPPHPHGPTPECDFAEQKKLTRAWALASSYLVWEARPDLSGGAIESAMKPLGESLSCQLCKEALEKRVKDVVVQWSLVKRTI